jgi:hypothetical protein
MPRLRKPFSAIDSQAFLKKSISTANKVPEGDKILIAPETILQATGLSAQFETQMGDIGTFSSQMQKEIREKNSAMSVLQTYMRDIWAGKRRHIYRENLPLEVFAFYQLPQSGNSPVLTQEGQWIETATLMIEGEKGAIAAGYPPMSNPSMAELTEKLEIATKERGDVTDADKQLDEAQESVSGLMPEAKKVINRIHAELEFNLHDKEDASKRRIMRNYGVYYTYTKNEPRDDDDPEEVDE